MKHVASLVVMALASGCVSHSHQNAGKGGSSSPALDTAARGDPTSTIMAAYQARKITADSAAQALFAVATRTHQPLTVAMDSALRDAVARAIRAHNKGPTGSNR
jgi:hypothetical protein